MSSYSVRMEHLEWFVKPGKAHTFNPHEAVEHYTPVSVYTYIYIYIYIYMYVYIYTYIYIYIYMYVYIYTYTHMPLNSMEEPNETGIYILYK